MTFYNLDFLRDSQLSKPHTNTGALFVGRLKFRQFIPHSAIAPLRIITMDVNHRMTKNTREARDTNRNKLAGEMKMKFTEKLVTHICAFYSGEYSLFWGRGRFNWMFILVVAQ